MRRRPSGPAFVLARSIVGSRDSFGRPTCPNLEIRRSCLWWCITGAKYFVAMRRGFMARPHVGSPQEAYRCIGVKGVLRLHGMIIDLRLFYREAAGGNSLRGLSLDRRERGPLTAQVNSWPASFFFANRQMQTEHLLLHDSQTTIRRVSFVFPQERCEDGETEEPGNVFVAGGGAET